MRETSPLRVLSPMARALHLQIEHHSAGDLCRGLIVSSAMAFDLNFLLVLGLMGQVSAYFADWSALAEDRQPTCVAIPANMTLCNNIGKFASIY